MQTIMKLGKLVSLESRTFLTITIIIPPEHPTQTTHLSELIKYIKKIQKTFYAQVVFLHVAFFYWIFGCWLYFFSHQDNSNLSELIKYYTKKYIFCMVCIFSHGFRICWNLFRVCWYNKTPFIEERSAKYWHFCRHSKSIYAAVQYQK